MAMARIGAGNRAGRSSRKDWQYIMWLRLAGPGSREEEPARAGLPQRLDADAERAERILASMAMDTFQVFEHLNRTQSRESTRDLSLEKLAEDATRACIMKTLAEARQDAYQAAAERARAFAEDCLKSYGSLAAGHQRVVVKCVAELFEQFAARLEREAADLER